MAELYYLTVYQVGRRTKTLPISATRGTDDVCSKLQVGAKKNDD